jgi:hypothetical protein
VAQVPPTPAPCLRCGAFAASYPLEDVRLCATCLETVPKKNVARPSAPPLAVQLARVIAVLPIGAVAVWFAAAYHVPFMIVVIAFTLVAAEVAHPLGTWFWKRSVIADLGLEHAPEAAAFTLAQYAPARPRGGRFTDSGLLAITPGGLAFLGRGGRRFAVPRARIRGAAVERITRLPLVDVLRIDLAATAPMYFRFVDTGTRSANRRRMLDVATRLSTAPVGAA